MASRLKLQSELEELLGSRNVYYDPPASTNMRYPAIRYTKNGIYSAYANNKPYAFHDSYQVIVISPLPDNPVINKLLSLPMSKWNDHYTADGLHHDVLTIYY